MHDVGYRPFLLKVAGLFDIKRFYADNLIIGDKKAVEELGIDAEVVKVTDINEISEWIFVAPGVAFDDLVVFEGKLPTVEEIKKELEDYVK